MAHFHYNRYRRNPPRRCKVPFYEETIDAINYYGGCIKVFELEGFLRCDRDKAHEILDAYVISGLLIKRGIGLAARYCLSEKHKPQRSARRPSSTKALPALPARSPKWTFDYVPVPPHGLQEEATRPKEPEPDDLDPDRDRWMVNKLKQVYNFTCQICQERITSRAGKPYAEGAHIIPFGAPHHAGRVYEGQNLDIPDNILILCSQHHTEFDLGIITVLPFLQPHANNYEFIIEHMRGAANPWHGNRLFVLPGHEINPFYLMHHRGRFIDQWSTFNARRRNPNRKMLYRRNADTRYRSLWRKYLVSGALEDYQAARREAQRLGLLQTCAMCSVETDPVDVKVFRNFTLCHDCYQHVTSDEALCEGYEGECYGYGLVPHHEGQVQRTVEGHALDENIYTAEDLWCDDCMRRAIRDAEAEIRANDEFEER